MLGLWRGVGTGLNKNASSAFHEIRIGCFNDLDISYPFDLVQRFAHPAYDVFAIKLKFGGHFQHGKQCLHPTSLNGKSPIDA